MEEQRIREIVQQEIRDTRNAVNTKTVVVKLDTTELVRILEEATARLKDRK